MKIFNLVSPQQSKDKTYWNPVGTMFVSDDNKINIRLNMFPDLSIKAFAKDDKKKQTRKRAPINQNPAPEYFSNDDNIPF